MKFERLRLEQFKCFGEVDLSLSPGVTVIHGLNGSGKSSLLEACFFALYGTNALERTLDEIVTIGADECQVDLWFAHDGGEYHVKRRIRVRAERAVTVEAVLEGPEGTFEGARDVRARVTELLRMDAAAFVNCAYVRQGEVNKLINASPSERQDMLDDLLQLGVLEDYRERASDARVGVGRVRDAKREVLSDVESQIEAKEDEDLHATRNELQSELNELREEVERYESQREAAVETRDDAAAILEEHEEKQAELQDLTEDIADLREQIEATEGEREVLAEEIQGLEDEREDRRSTREELCNETVLDTAEPNAIAELREELEDEREAAREAITELSVEKQEHESEAESRRETAADLDERAEATREEATELAETVESQRSKLDEKREELETLEEEIDDHRETFEDAPVDVGEAASHRDSVAETLSDQREAVAELRSTVESDREALEEAKALRDAGKCPECGQDVEGSPHVDTIEDDEAALAERESELSAAEDELADLREQLETAETLADAEAEIERLSDRRATVSQLIDERENSLEEKADRVETLREEADELEAEAAEAREAADAAAEAADGVREKIGKRNQEQRKLNERIHRLESLAETVERLAEIEDEIERRRERRTEKAETNAERRERLADLRERRSELAEAVDESQVEDARAEKERAEKYIEEVDETLETKAERRDDLTSRIGAVENEIEALADLRDRREALEATVENLESLYDEAEDLQGLYGTLRAELRRQNVETLERLVNETFDLIYENDAYSHIELDGDYRLTVYQKDGEALDPEQLSGGERALFNLSLRCGIYRLLAEGIDGAAPMPPLILDEPTTFLDSGHVSQLVELIGAMYDMGVEQILVVSHDDELVGAADDLVTVRTDATTNRSTVERVRDADTGLLVEAGD